LPVHLGTLEEAGFADGEFDAIVMNHVLEHVHNPLRLLNSCIRLLRVGGTLVAVTPNAESDGHRRFGASWYHLDPPRHLHLFSQKTLRDIANRAGFAKCDTWTSAANAQPAVAGSLEIRRSAGMSGTSIGLAFKIWAVIYQVRMSLAHRKNPCAGEECVLRARR
jgi:SAM-dependent methyltransferase